MRSTAWATTIMPSLSLSLSLSHTHTHTHTMRPRRKELERERERHAWCCGVQWGYLGCEELPVRKPCVMPSAPSPHHSTRGQHAFIKRIRVCVYECVCRIHARERAHTNTHQHQHTINTHSHTHDILNRSLILAVITLSTECLEGQQQDLSASITSIPDSIVVSPLHNVAQHLCVFVCMCVR